MESVQEQIPGADEVMDEVMPSELDWQRLVRRYPIAAITIGIAKGRSAW